MSTAPFDLLKAHRWFAIELNNRAWELIEAPARTAEETAEMITAAHASRYHWNACGTLLNKVRAESLVAAAYLAAQRVDEAMPYVNACLQLATKCPEVTPFDVACAQGNLAIALKQLGRMDEAKAAYAMALREAATFEHADDREVFDKLYPAP
jgi:tetratricopeptide (TPR) repeat protein